MNRWTSPASVLLFLVPAACSQPTIAQPETQPTPVPSSTAEPAPKSDAIARADALLEDFRRREAAQAKFDRANAAAAAVPIPASLPPSRPTSPAATVAPPSTAATQAPPATVASAAPARDEMWWKQQMRSLQLTLDEELVKLADAEKANLKFGYNDAQAEYKKRLAAVANARLAIDRLHDDARRASVPPSWLRLP